MENKKSCWKVFWKQFTDSILDILYPCTCPVCDEALKSGVEICPQCMDKFVYIHEPRCKKCGKYLGNQSNSEYQEYCPDCRKIHHSYDFGIAVFALNDEMRHSIYRFKYQNRRTYASFYGKAMAYYGKALFAALEIEVIIPIPIHKKKKRQRGFNQTELIAEVLGEELQIPVCKNLLIRTRNTIPQKELNYQERRNNVKNAFQIDKNLVQYKKILLVDDIYTTGSTIDSCAEVLKIAGIQRVYFVSLSIGTGI